jgi:hypothetical protein
MHDRCKATARLNNVIWTRTIMIIYQKNTIEQDVHYHLLLLESTYNIFSFTNNHITTIHIQRFANRTPVQKPTLELITESRTKADSPELFFTELPNK